MLYIVCRNPSTAKDISKNALRGKKHGDHAHIIYVRHLDRSTGRKGKRVSRLPDGSSLYYPVGAYRRACLDRDRLRGILSEHDYNIRHGRQCRVECVFCYSIDGAGNREQQALSFDEFSEKILALISTPHETSTGKLKELRHITTDGYRYVLNKLQKVLGDDLTFPLRQSQIEEFVKKRIAAKISPRTVNTDLRSLKAVLNLAVKHGILPQDSTPHIALYDVDDKAIEILTREQVNAVDAAATKRGHLHQLVIFALMYQGLRPGDLSPYRQNSPQGIKWKHVNFDQHLIAVRGKTEKETAKWLSMSPKLEAVLRNWPDKHGTEERIFPYSKQRLWDKVKAVFKDVGIAHNVPYVLRKTFVTYFSEVAGVDSAREAARHSSTDTTMKFYNHVRFERQHKGHEDFLASFAPAKNGKGSSKNAEEMIKSLLLEHPELQQKFVQAAAGTN